jgi:hypothetical protein
MRMKESARAWIRLSVARRATASTRVPASALRVAWGASRFAPGETVDSVPGHASPPLPVHQASRAQAAQAPGSFSAAGPHEQRVTRDPCLFWRPVIKI